MIFKEPAPLSPEAEGLLAQERTLVAAPADLKARVLARVRTVPGPSLAPFRVKRPWSKLRTISLAACGVAAASVAYAWYESGASAPITPARLVVTPIAERAQLLQEHGSRLPAPAEQLEATPSRAASSGTAGTRAEPTGSGVQADSAELTLLQRARLSLNRGAYRTTLGELAEHQRRFPSSPLAEEREALRIRALLGVGKRDEARQAAERFRRRYPRSVLTPQLSEGSSAE